MTNIPQQYQIPHVTNRRVMDTSFGCAPPEPIQIPVLNAITNKTTYLDIPREVHDVEITFNYEIRHASDVHWDEGADSEEDSDGGWFSKLFGGRMLNNKTEGNETGTILEQLESDMVSTIWNVVLNDSDMTFNTDGECAGLFISEQNETLLTDDANAGFQAATEDETMLLGLSVYPADEVNPDGEKRLLTYITSSFTFLSAFLTLIMFIRVHQLF